MVWTVSRSECVRVCVKMKFVAEIFQTFIFVLIIVSFFRFVIKFSNEFSLFESEFISMNRSIDLHFASEEKKKLFEIVWMTDYWTWTADGYFAIFLSFSLFRLNAEASVKLIAQDQFQVNRSSIECT